MVNYNLSKIYKIYPMVVGVDEGDVYFGSTTQALSKRMVKHRTSYKTGNDTCSSKILFEKYGVENCVIELVEEYPCENKEQLSKREGFFIRNNMCVNVRIAGRSKKEYFLENPCIKKEYYEANKCRILHNMKIYRDTNVELIRERKRVYYEKNKDIINEKRRVKK